VKGDSIYLGNCFSPLLSPFPFTLIRKRKRGPEKKKAGKGGREREKERAPISHMGAFGITRNKRRRGGKKKLQEKRERITLRRLRAHPDGLFAQDGKEKKRVKKRERTKHYLRA